MFWSMPWGLGMIAAAPFPSHHKKAWSALGQGAASTVFAFVSPCRSSHRTQTTRSSHSSDTALLLLLLATSLVHDHSPCT